MHASNYRHKEMKEYFLSFLYSVPSSWRSMVLARDCIQR